MSDVLDNLNIEVSLTEAGTGFNSSAYPVHLKLGPGVKQQRVLTAAEARELSQALIRLVHEAEDRGVVQVKVSGASREYSYESGGLSLKVGDFVKVPFGFNDAPRLGTVTAHGRGTYAGALKSVTSKLVEETA